MPPKERGRKNVTPVTFTEEYENWETEDCYDAPDVAACSLSSVSVIVIVCASYLLLMFYFRQQLTPSQQQQQQVEDESFVVPLPVAADDGKCRNSNKEKQWQREDERREIRRIACSRGTTRKTVDSCIVLYELVLVRRIPKRTSEVFS